MTRLVIGVLVVVLTLPMLVVAAVAPGAGAVSASGGGTDEAQVTAAPAGLQDVFVTVAREAALPPALLVAVAEVAPGFDQARGLMGLTASEWSRFGARHEKASDPYAAVGAAARLLLAAGATPEGGWDAAAGLRGYSAVAERTDQVLTLAATYGYRYSRSGPPLDPDRYAFPVAGDAAYGAYHHDYPATDIFAPIGTPIVACVPAVVLRVSRADVGKGGITVTLRGEDGWRYYYAHLAGIAADIAPGDVVQPGRLLGWSGKSGNARDTPPHLHLGISLYGPTAGEIDPYPYLNVWPRVTT